MIDVFQLKLPMKSLDEFLNLLRWSANKQVIMLNQLLILEALSLTGSRVPRVEWKMSETLKFSFYLYWC